MVAIGYTRVSTDHQADTGVSLDAQAEKIRAMAVAKGFELLDIIVDAGKSAGTLKRPGLDRLLGLVDRRKIQAVIVTSHDRLSRKLLEQLRLLDRFKRHRVVVISVTESWDTSTAAGQLQTNIMGSVAQHYRDYVSERTPRSPGPQEGQRSTGRQHPIWFSVGCRWMHDDRQLRGAGDHHVDSGASTCRALAQGHRRRAKQERPPHPTRLTVATSVCG